MKKRSQEEIDLLTSLIKINADEVYEVRHWAKQFRVTDSQLRAAIAQVGPLVISVRQHFAVQGAAEND